MDRRAIAGNVLVYGVSHALVDAACAAFLFAAAASGPADPQGLFDRIVAYNVIAFAAQPVFGLLVDAFGMAARAAALGMTLGAAAALLRQFPGTAVLTAGIGNALFHVGGGVTSLNLAPRKAALPGIFVAPGALGLVVGILVGKSGYFTAWPFVLLLIGLALLILRLPGPAAPAVRKFPDGLKWFETIIVLLLVSIAIRSLVGLSLVLPWKSDPGLLFTLTAAVVLGKALGGVLGDRFGCTAVAVAGLAVSAPLLAFFPQIPSLVFLGVFLFNLSMPVTLIGLAEMFPGKVGFAFGLTTLALLIGGLPAYTPLRGWTGLPAAVFVTILVSVAALYGGLRLYERHFSGRAPDRPRPAGPE
jgi:FSR family fosmidomycin resistance protein-like MFS transporter